MTTLPPTLTAALVAAIMSTGCLTPSHANETATSCDPTFMVNCWDNPDASYLLEEYGLNQFTNVSMKFGNLGVSRGLVSFTTGGFGDPFHARAFSLPAGQQQIFEESEDFLINAVRHGPEGLWFTMFPRGENSDKTNGKVWIWYPGKGNGFETPPEVPVDTLAKRKEGTDYIPRAFDGTWAIVENLRKANPLSAPVYAINVDTGATRTLFHQDMPQYNARDRYHVPAAAASNGSAFLYVYDDDEKTTDLVEIELATGNRTTIKADMPGRFTRLDASHDYVVHSHRNRTGYFIDVYHRGNQSWSAFATGTGAPLLLPRVGGDWVMYGEDGHQGVSAGVMATHLPTMTHHELLRGTRDFSYIDWDTDGEYAVFTLQPHDLPGSSMTVENFRAQGYWMNLPDAPSSPV